MRISVTEVIFIALLATLVSCGGDPEPESVDSLSVEVTADTVITEEPMITDVSEQLSEAVETVPVAADPAGLWDTTMGQLELVVDDSEIVTGEYPLGTLQGTLTDNTLTFTYSEGSLSGEGTFTYEGDFNSFTGVQDISGTEFVWDGRRLQAQ
ncbi:MAG: hypothetical protein KAR44_04195 [Candidatus Aegiribacteria sp.]|nr:hypothetical protein [Candidatus Aegiribacteria sp.]